MEQRQQLFEATQPTGFFNDLGSGIRLSKKQTIIRSEILDGSHQNIQQKSLQQKIERYKRPEKGKRVTRDNAQSSLPAVPSHSQQIKPQSNIPEKTFQDLKLIKPLLKVVSELEYRSPTPIQCLTIPAVLSGKDVMASSITGSGKTAAFLLPILQRYYRSAPVNYCRVLIITPTRELAIQCYQNFSGLNKYIGIDACLVIGASSAQKQQSQLRNHPQIVIATPGRLLDLLANSMSFGLQSLEILVFDEADKLLEMGFQHQIKQILSYLNSEMQTLLFSATMGTSIDKLAAMSMRKPIRISADPENSTAEKLHQQIYKLTKDSETYREAALLTILTKVTEYTKKVIIFFKTKKQCHRMAILMGLLDLPACELHGNLSQTQRITAFNDFKEGKYDYLLATDLAARGLDVKQVKSVINFELPTELTRYIHRVGRTARAGAIGSCLSLCDDRECLKLKKMIRSTGDKLFRLSLADTLILENQRNVQELERDYKRIIEDEKQERQLRLAEMEVQKLENIQQHQTEIMNRPKKHWFLTNQQKNQIRQNSKREAQGEDYKATEKPPRTKKIHKQKDRPQQKGRPERKGRPQQKGRSDKKQRHKK